MNIRIIYASKTGITQRLAEIVDTIFREKKHEVTLSAIDAVTDINDLHAYDLVMIGSYCDSNHYPKKMKNLFHALGPVKSLASFVTHATYESGAYYEKWAAGCETFFQNYCNERHIVNQGYFHCRGKPSKAISIFVRMFVIQDKQDWKEYQRDMNDYPTEHEIQRFKEYIHRLV